MSERRPGVYCQICGGLMDPKYVADKRRWYFLCPQCGERTPIKDGRGQAAQSARTYDALKRSLRREIRCPYFVGAKDARIACEAPCAASALIMDFGKRDALIAHMARFCRGRYGNCPICRANDGEYK